MAVAGEAEVGDAGVGRRRGGEHAEGVVAGVAAADEVAVHVAQGHDVAQVVGQGVVELVRRPVVDAEGGYLPAQAVGGAGHVRAGRRIGDFVVREGSIDLCL